VAIKSNVLLDEIESDNFCVQPIPADSFEQRMHCVEALTRRRLVCMTWMFIGTRYENRMDVSLNLLTLRSLRASAASRCIRKGNSHLRDASRLVYMYADKREIILSTQECGWTITANLIIDSSARENIISGYSISKRRGNQEVAVHPREFNEILLSQQWHYSFLSLGSSRFGNEPLLTHYVRSRLIFLTYGSV
jgi:hypothetical protein